MRKVHARQIPLGQQEAGMPAKQPKCPSTDTQPALDSRGQPAGGHAAA